MPRWRTMWTTSTTIVMATVASASQMIVRQDRMSRLTTASSRSGSEAMSLISLRLHFQGGAMSVSGLAASNRERAAVISTHGVNTKRANSATSAEAARRNRCG